MRCQHSPAPWVMHSNIVLLDADGCTIAVLSKTRFGGGVKPAPRPPGDALLLQAAPEMYALLRGMVDAIEHAPEAALVIREGSELHHQLIEMVGRCADGR